MAEPRWPENSLDWHCRPIENFVVFRLGRRYLLLQMNRRRAPKHERQELHKQQALADSSFALIRAFKLYFRAPGSQPFLVLLCLIIAGFAEALSLGAIVPLVGLIDSSGSTPGLQIVELMRRTFAWAGVPMTFGALTAFVAIAMSLKALLSFAALAIASFARVRLMTVLRLELINSLLSAKWSYFADQRFGSIANALSTDMMAASVAYISAARYLASLFQTLALVGVGFLISWQAMLAAMGIAALLMLILRLFMNPTHRSGAKHFKRTASLLGVLVDTLNNLKPLKTMSRNEQVAALMATHSYGAQKAKIKQEVLKAGLQNSQLALTAIIFACGAFLAVEKLDMPLAGLVGLSVLVFRIVNSFSRGQMVLQTFTENEGGYWRSLNFIRQAKAAVEEDTGNVTPTLNDGCLFEDVSFSHGTMPILSKVKLFVPANEITVIQGPSGAGKTTIIDLLTGLHRPTSGQILIDGIDLKDISLRSWRSMIGYVPQELSLLHTSIAENITLGDATIGESEVWQALEIAGAAGFVRELHRDLATDVGEVGSKLSGGQRQRIALARALVRRPKLLIFDEVTSALDPDTERDICQRISKLTGEITIVAITHRPAWNSIATRVYSVGNGEVTEQPQLSSHSSRSQISS
jgi:ATP-binding cassette subfamily C protein